MPCPACNHTLAYHQNKSVLYCADCLELPVADNALIKQKATEIRNQYLSTPKLIEILNKYGSLRVVVCLLQELNEGAAGMTNENRMSFRKFFHALPILMSVYEHAGDFENHFDPQNNNVQEEIDERVEALLDAGTELIPILKSIREDFTVPLEFTPGYGNWTDFYGNHLFLNSEFWLCSERCLQANVGARDEIRDDFLKQQTIFRSFNKPEKKDIETVRDWGDFWYGLIVSLGFASAIDDTIKGAFTTQFPDSVTIFDIEALLNEIESVVEASALTRGTGDYPPAAVSERDFNECGEEVFGEDWYEVKSSLVVSAENTNAHPMFFKLSGTESVQLPNWRQPRPISFTDIMYPYQFSLLVKFQLFPFLKNGNQETSTDVLSYLTAKRGKEFEQYVYEYLVEKSLDAYYSCKTTKQNGNEVDVIFIHDETVFFVESKYVLPTLNMQSQRGIQDVNDKLDGLIFKEGTSEGGKPFPEKVNTWRELNSDAEILHQPTIDCDNHEWIEIPDEWCNLNHEMLVVSNFVPSYLEKQGVRFITDLELYQWIEHDTNVFYSVLH